MAIDTPDKRAAAIAPAQPWRSSLPFPDGAIGAADREFTARIYPGFAWLPTVGTSYGDSIDGLLNPDPGGSYLQALSTFSPPAVSVWNTNLWGGGGALLDFSGIAWLNVGQPYPRSVAITKRHILCTEHGANSISSDLYFIKPDGTAVTRQGIDAITYIGTAVATTSFRVLYLNSDLPAEIRLYKLMADRATTMDANPMVKFDQEGKALIADVSFYSDTVGLVQPSSSTRQLYYEAVTGGDSGSPAFFVVGTELVYDAGLTTSGTAGGVGPAASHLIGQILNACAVLDARNAATGYVPTLFRADYTRGARSYVARMLQGAA